MENLSETDERFVCKLDYITVIFFCKEVSFPYLQSYFTNISSVNIHEGSPTPRCHEGFFNIEWANTRT